MLEGAFDFSGRTAVVTGGSGVLCGTLAAALGECGAAVVVLGHRHMDKARAVAGAIVDAGGNAVALEADVLDRTSLEQVCARVLDQFGGLDILINGAGGARKAATTGPDQSFFDLPEAAVREVFDLNFMGTLLPSQVFGRVMAERDRGVILNMASLGAYRPLTRSVAYSAAKAAVVNFTQWLAVHLSQEYSRNIRVNALVPGFFLTEQNRFLLLDAQGSGLTERGRRIVEHTPMARLGRPEELVGPALMLLSDVTGFVHGSTVVVDGGISAYGGV